MHYALPFILVLFIQINGFAEVSIEFNDTRLEMAFDSISRQAALTMVVTDAKGAKVAFEDKRISFKYDGDSWENAVLGLIKKCEYVVLEKDESKKTWKIGKQKP